MTTNEKRKDAFSSLKQRLSAIQLVLKKDFAEGRVPQTEDADKFIAISEEMHRSCQADWRAAMDRYMGWLAQFKTAMRKGERTVIEDAFHELIECKNACHKSFRKR